jgi:hypothetical protein
MSGSQIQNSNEQQLFENKIEPMWASTKVAAALLGISPNALRIRKFRGQIECRYFGNQLRFNVNYIHSLLRETREERKE